MSFILSKIAWMFLSPGNFLILLLLAGAFLAVSRHEKWRGVGRMLSFEVAFLLFFIAVFPVGEWLLIPLENRFPPAMPAHITGIIVIGSDENPRLSEARGQPVGRDAASDFMHTAILARKYPQARILFSGGPSFMMPRGAKMDEADVADDALKALGVDQGRIMIERRSRNTYENAVFSAATVHPQPGQAWLLVTEAYHMPRSMACFRAAGFDVYPAPTDYLTSGKLSSAVHFDLTGHLDEMAVALHEYYGLLAYWAVGYIETPWPG